MSPESPESPKYIIGPDREKESRKSSISLDTGLTGPPQKLDPSPGEQRSPIVRILLSESASRHLDASGERAFTIIAKDMSDGTAGRWVIHLAPIDWRTAQDASAVLLGKARAVRIKRAIGPPQALERTPLA